MNKRELLIKLYTCMIFIGCVICFVVLVWLMLPRKFAAMVLALAGLVMMVGGPFWAMGLERSLRDRFIPRNKSRELLEKIWNEYLEEEDNHLSKEKIK